MEFSAIRFRESVESIFSRMTRLALERSALNLAQGFPDFSGPSYLIERMHAHLLSCPNQYTRSAGHPILCTALHEYSKRFLPRAYDATCEITVTAGATEGIFCVIAGLVNPGQKVLVFEPYYESYLACAKIAGGELVGVPLLPPIDEEDVENGVWTIDWSRFEQAMTDDVALIMLNHPHNPTGKVFGIDELERIFATARARDIPVAIDGVYEHLVYSSPKNEFTPFIERYSDQTIFISGIAKSLSFTGFKIGWIFAPNTYTKAIRAAHEAVIFCLPTHAQLAVADMLNNDEIFVPYISGLKESLRNARDEMRSLLKHFGFRVPNAQGSYFLLAQKHVAPLFGATDQDLSMDLLERYKIATIPVSGFFTGTPVLSDWLRFAFCKRPETVAALKNALASRL